MNITLLITLLMCHWLGDYTHLSMPSMLAAKKFGKPLLPIFLHAYIHCLLTMGALLFFTWDWKVVALGSTIMLFTHFAIDVLKGRLNKRFEILQNPAEYPHWYVFGLDQLLHTVIIIIIWQIAIQ